MEEQDDLDLQLQRASRWTLPRLQSRLARLSSTPNDRPLLSAARNIGPMLDVFQEDPQQLDPHLKNLLPPLIAHYLELIQDPEIVNQSSLSWQQSREIAKVLSQFCKVRGAKVVSQFLNNEPRYIEPILDAYALVCQDGTQRHGKVGTDSSEASLDDERVAPQDTWQEAYTMLLWLGHLMLAPFDLSTISADYNQALQSGLPSGLELEINIPSIAMRVLEIALSGMTSADKRQSAAAALLVRLVTRRDMQETGLLDATVEWALERLGSTRRAATMTIHEFVGLLSFLSGIVVSADTAVVGRYLSRLFYIVMSLFSEDTTFNKSLTSSAVAKRVAIKIQRSIVLVVLAAKEGTDIDVMTILEDVIDFLLRALGDRDTQVRKAASKALSVITGKVAPEMGEEIVEAVLGSLNEDVFVQNGTRNIQSVNPLRWHGLTLTLAQMLFRRSPSPAQLPSILSALFLALDFEQRSAAGSSVGGNVRDAANFGLWSLARRYTTKELEEVDPRNVEGQDTRIASYSILQLTACHLLSAACLDPVGNVRRGSSAALQELIGRHPNTIQEGISLVQTVDYQAVGLRKRATTDVAFSAAKLHETYRSSIRRDLLGWRGIGTIDKLAREYSASGTGKTSTLFEATEAEALTKQLVIRLNETPRNEVEDRHGIVSALASVVRETGDRLSHETIELLWRVFEDSLALTKDDFDSASTRPELTAGAVVVFISKLAACTLKRHQLHDSKPSKKSLMSARKTMQICMPHIVESNYVDTISAVRSFSKLIAIEEVSEMIQFWTRELQQPRMPYRKPAMVLALGAIYSCLDDKDDDTRQYILDTLVKIANTDQDIEAKVIAVRSVALLTDVLPGVAFCTDSQYETILETIESSLNDYTINRRGDVGSLLRTEALSTFSKVATAGQPSKHTGRCYLICHRLALEKLHKVRAAAAQCLIRLDTTAIPGLRKGKDLTSLDVSTFEYFESLAQKLAIVGEPPSIAPDQPNWEEGMTLAILEGFSNTAGVGPDDVLQSSRTALLDALDDFIQESNPSVIRRITDALLNLLRNSLSVERTLVPILQLFTFLLDAGVLQRLAAVLAEPGFRWRTLLSLVQKAHFKSTAMPKLLVAVDVYRGLAEVPEIRNEVITKLANMLLHPFPRIRVAVAETLWVVTADQALKPIRFTEAPQGKRFVEDFKAKHCS